MISTRNPQPNQQLAIIVFRLWAEPMRPGIDWMKHTLCSGGTLHNIQAYLVMRKQQKYSETSLSNMDTIATAIVCPLWGGVFVGRCLFGGLLVYFR